jgi:hypothetical protein
MGRFSDCIPVVLIAEISDTLSSFGLSVEKLDKWTELASMGNAKKLRRKGRQTC